MPAIRRGQPLPLFLGFVLLLGARVPADEATSAGQPAWHEGLETRQQQVQPENLQLLGLQVSKLPRDHFGQGIPPIGPPFVRSWIVGSGTGLYGAFKIGSYKRLVFQEESSSLDQFTDDRGRDLTESPDGEENRSEFHAALLMYKGVALHRLGLLAAARDALTAALRRKKDRSDQLLRAIRYERALVYAAMGQAKRARSELGRVYAEDPDYEDVATRLGLGSDG